MTAKLGIFLLRVMVALLSCSNSYSYPNSIDQWCDKTPHPEPCKYFLRQTPQSMIPKSRSEFRKLAIELAKRRAETAHGHTKLLEQKCRNEKEKAAWLDCLVLYDETILQLSQTLDQKAKATDYDVQTWLSTALTNLQTCRSGFSELGVEDYVLPFMSNNVTKLISNSLSLGQTNGSTIPPHTYVEGFPSWLTTNSRKLLQASSPAANLVVAQDGSGNYRTIAEAVSAAGKRSGGGRFVIHIKKGVYKENIEIGKSLKNIMFIGDGMGSTVITGSRSVNGGSTTFRSATLAVTGGGFIARDMTIRNTAGPQNHQAVALRSGSDLSVFYRCSIEGYQDTLYVHSQRQFYRDCNIHGTVDFIFGNAAAVLQNCMIYARKPLSNQKNTVTAQGRTDPNQNTGISIISSKVMTSWKTYLGRPWQQYSRTVFMKTYLDSMLDPAGWLEWSGNFALNTLFYGEYMNTGPGASTSGRVKWKGYKVITSATEASKFTVSNFIAGQSWLPATGVPYTAGL